MSMPLRNGAWSRRRSALETAPQRTASRKASRRCGGSNPCGSGSAARSVSVGAGLQLPDDLDLLAEGIVLHRRERDEMLRRVAIAARKTARQGAPGDLGDHPLSAPNFDKLPLLRRLAHGHVSEVPSPCAARV